MSDDKYFISEAPEGNMPADGQDTPQPKPTTITVEAFFSGYMLAGMDGQEFAQLTPKEQLQARIDFLHDRASHIAGLPAGQVKREAARMVRSLDAAQGAVEAGDISNAAMHFLDAGRFMERVTSSQLAGLALEKANMPKKALDDKNKRLKEAQDQVIENYLATQPSKKEKRNFAHSEAERVKSTGVTIGGDQIYKVWLNKKTVQDHINSKK